MKKLLSLLIAVIMVLSMAACGGNEATDHSGENSETNPNGTQTDQGNERKKDDNGSSAVNALTQAQMEAEILRRLSAVSALESLTLCGGTAIEYTEDGIFFAGDYWTVSNPDLSGDALFASLDSQLLAAGFTKSASFFGYEYTVKAGVGSIGLSILYSGEDGEVIFRMTNHRDEYNQAYIEAENAKLPTIIEGLSVLERLPENFSITFLYSEGRYRTSICRYNGGYYVENEYLDDADYDYHFIFYYAAVPNDAGGYDFYEWTDTTKRWDNSVEYEEPNPVDYFVSSDTDPEQYVASCLGYGVWSEYGTASTWLKMCYDYLGLALPEEMAENSFYDKACIDFSVNSNMTRVGETTFLGRSCETVHSEGLWATTYDLTFDLETGLTMKITVEEPMNGETVTVTYFEVIELDLNPTSLGKFVEPTD